MSFHESDGLAKTLVVGIDSGCWAYLDPLLSTGRMPNLDRLISRGVRGVLESTIPPITPVAFSSFITGTNPGKHGVFDWTVREAGGHPQPVSAAVREGAPFWHYLNRAGVRVGLFNIPVTYPPQKIDGFLVPGIPVPAGSRSMTHPPQVLDQIEERFGPYQVDVPRTELDNGVGSYVSAWIQYEEAQTSAALMLANDYDVDVLVINYASLDRVNHFSPCQEHLGAVLANVDVQIGRFLEQFPQANFILMSDHGSRRIERAFLLGKWLVQNGYAVYGEKSLDVPRYEINSVLARYFRARGISGSPEWLLRNLLRVALGVTPNWLRRPVWRWIYRAAPEALEYRLADRLDWSLTRVCTASNSGSLVLHRRGLSSRGASEREYEDLREALMRDLSRARDPQTGCPVFSRVLRREDAYHGPHVHRAPDLFADHYDSDCDLIVDSDPGSFCFVERLDRFGDHSREGILVLNGPDFMDLDGQDHRASIIDLPATLLHLYGIPVPRDFDGRVLTEFLREESMSRNPVRVQEAVDAGTPSGDIGYSELEQQQLTDHLRGLGYL